MTTEKDLHTEHCCLRHGCKYIDEDRCTVINRLKPQSFPCEECEEETEEEAKVQAEHDRDAAILINEALTRERDELIRILWELFLASCWCHMDYHSTCSCQVYEATEKELEQILGPEWHTLCRKRFPRKQST